MSNNKIKNILKELNFNNEKQAVNALKKTVISNIKRNDFKSADYFIDKLLILNSNDYENIRDKAYICYNLNNFENSKDFIEKALRINKKDVFGLNIYALIKMSNKNYSEAITILEDCIKLNSSYIDSYNNLGTCFFEIENITDAFKNFKKAYKINKNNINALINIGNILSLNDKYSQAINFFKKVLNINPNNINVLTNIAICYCRQKDIVNAERIFKKLKEISSNSHELNYIYSTALLNLGYFDKAWPLFESRLHLKNREKYVKDYGILNKTKSTSQINLKSDKILILREQGIGEEILFSSLYKNILDFNDNVIIESDKRLVNTFKRSFKKNIFYEDGYFSSKISNLEKFDKIIFAGSLCQYFIKNKESFSKKRYLFPDSEMKKKFKKYFSNNNKAKIGLSWKSKISVYGSLKSLKLSYFEPLFTSNRELFSLQYGDIEEEKNLMNENKNKLKFFDNVDLFNDLESLMGILSNLDVFVTVSNSTAHISAALGVKTIIICPKKSSTYFYWNSMEKKSFWYENVIVLTLDGSIANTIKRIDQII